MSGPLRVGAWDVDLFTDGTWRLDGGSMFGRVPRVLWEQHVRPDESHRVPLTCRSLLLRNGAETVLVDTGPGRVYDERFARQTGLSERWQFVENLASLGVTLDNVDYVLLTHLHFDHVGGAITVSDSGEVVPTFPNARHIIHPGEWEAAHDGNPLTRRSYAQQPLDVLEQAGLIDFVDGGEILPGIRLEVTGGHTEHHQLVTVGDGGSTVCYPADLLPLTPHINPAWVLAFDTHPLVTAAKRSELLHRAADEDWTIVLNHDIERASGRVVSESVERFAWRED